MKYSNGFLGQDWFVPRVVRATEPPVMNKVIAFLRNSAVPCSIFDIHWNSARAFSFLGKP
jgi:hypothetical protein